MPSPIAASLVAIVALLLAATSPVSAANCFTWGKQCPQSVPYCSSRTQSCSASKWDSYTDTGCIAASSYNNACSKTLPGCKSGRITFPNGSVPPAANFTDSDKNPFVVDSGTAAAVNGQLVLNIKYDETAGRGLLSRVVSTRKFKYGNYTARIKISEGKGLVYTWIWKADANQAEQGDELDWEYVPGYKNNEPESNMFVKGREDIHAGRYHLLPPGQTMDGWHTYGFVYTEKMVQWTMDGAVVRQESVNATNPTPTSDGFLFGSIWDTCKGALGTQQWAGGPPAWCDSAASAATRSATWNMIIDYVDIQCMAGNEDISVATPVADAVGNASSIAGTTATPTGAAVAGATGAAKPNSGHSLTAGLGVVLASSLALLVSLL
ncbi:concanavalin A-like lectin/glucanase domain-containing protein [Blastocladiella britannica]|nr:concanavalin A-like lectin/glucanase domain-containing protein [Blastocladiella britannica]